MKESSNALMIIMNRAAKEVEKNVWSINAISYRRNSPHSPQRPHRHLPHIAELNGEGVDVT